ncbi:MAG: SMEK domain-containing protein [Gammaproteobacteria bacterium]|nr:SMEK domain-containing protein [Gammaproteobacteria bacterium]
MNHQQLLTQFREELAKLSLEVELSGAMSQHDINNICENVFCGIFKELYGFKNLRNLNAEERKNFPGIDLADVEAKVAIQVTSEKTIDKIKASLETFIEHNLHKETSGNSQPSVITTGSHSFENSYSQNIRM